eukprot:6613040-Alexandrium_andersonii.AAC.1
MWSLSSWHLDIQRAGSVREGCRGWALQGCGVGSGVGVSSGCAVAGSLQGWGADPAGAPRAETVRGLRGWQTPWRPPPFGNPRAGGRGSLFAALPGAASGAA